MTTNRRITKTAHRVATATATFWSEFSYLSRRQVELQVGRRANARRTS